MTDMYCSVGRIVGWPKCSADTNVLFNQLPFELQHRILERVTAEVQRNVESIRSICYVHYQQFDSKYKTFQHQYHGCCNIKEHPKPCFTNLVEISEHLLRDKVYFILPGRFICQPCQAKLLQQKIETLGESLTTLVIGENYEPDLLLLGPPTLPSSSTSSKSSELESASSDALETTYSYDSIQSLYIEHTGCMSSNFEPLLRPHQAKTIFNMLSGSDVLCVLPTNSGKTYGIILPTLLLAKRDNIHASCLIVSPLINLMDDTSKKLNTLGLQCLRLTETTLKSGEAYTFIALREIGMPVYLLTSPETLRLAEARKFLLQAEVAHIQVDECHCVETWSKDFRTDYKFIYEVRQYLDCPMGLFTGTLTPIMKDLVLNKCGIRKNDVILVSASLDRPEIFLEARLRSRPDISLKVFADEINQLQGDAMKTIVFVSTIEHTHELNYQFRELLENKGRTFNDKNKLDGYRSEHFSSVTEDFARDRILQDFMKPNGKIRILFSTVSYGMGLDNTTVQRVVLWDTDNDPCSSWQKIGRVARGSDSWGHAIIFLSKAEYHKRIREKTCLRQSILQHFVGFEEKTIGSQKHDECDGIECFCGLCKCCSVHRTNCICPTRYFPPDIEMG